MLIAFNVPIPGARIRARVSRSIGTRSRHDERAAVLDPKDMGGMRRMTVMVVVALQRMRFLLLL